MRSRSEAQAVVEAPATALWETVAAAGGVDRWFGEAISACEISGTGRGAERRCTMVDGAELRERILDVDHEKKRFVYAVEQHPLPAGGLVSTIDIEDLGDGRARVIWAAEYEADEAHAAQIDQTLLSLYGQGIEALAAHCAGGRP